MEQIEQGAEIQKSEEELKFEELLKEARSMPFEPDMEEEFGESDNIEKQSIFELFDLKLRLDSLAHRLQILEMKSGQGLFDKTKDLITGNKKRIEEEVEGDKWDLDLREMLAGVGLTMPTTSQEAYDAAEKVVNYENFKKVKTTFELG